MTVALQKKIQKTIAHSREKPILVYAVLSIAMFLFLVDAMSFLTIHTANIDSQTVIIATFGHAQKMEFLLILFQKVTSKLGAI
jgi:hypothetical protein